MITVGLADWTSALQALPGFVQAALTSSTPATPAAAQANALVQPPFPEPAKTNYTPYIILGGVGVLAVGVLAIMLGRRKHASAAPAAATSSGV